MTPVRETIRTSIKHFTIVIESSMDNEYCQRLIIKMFMKNGEKIINFLEAKKVSIYIVSDIFSLYKQVAGALINRLIQPGLRKGTKVILLIASGVFL